MKPGTLVTVDFRGVNGIKRRPAVVVSSDSYNRERPDLILAIVTGQVQKSFASTDHVLKDWPSANLTRPSARQVQNRLKIAIEF